MKYLIDTDWVIDHLKQVEKTTRKLEELASQGLAMSIISMAELYEEVCYSRDPVRSEETLKQFLSPESTILGIDEETCQIFGKERGRLRQGGRTIGDLDLFIASTCMRHYLTLLSNNRRHFAVVLGSAIISV